jgi:hypothetical protein
MEKIRAPTIGANDAIELVCARATVRARVKKWQIKPGYYIFSCNVPYVNSGVIMATKSALVN